MSLSRRNNRDFFQGGFGHRGSGLVQFARSRDGGIRDVAPLRNVISDGYDDIMCVVCQSRDLIGDKLDTGNLLKLIDRVSDIMVNEMVENDLGIIKEYREIYRAFDRKNVPLPPRISAFAQAKATVVRPLEPIDVDILDFAESDIADMIEKGARAVRDLP